MGAQSGQAAVEAAIVLPLFVFLILGILQLGLMHQARLMTKYAAYKAVRAGSLHNAKVEVMEKAALAVLMPMVSSRTGGADGFEVIRPVGSSQEFETKWNEVGNNQMAGVGLKYAEVTICGPTQEDIPANSPEFDFDDPKNTAPTGWRQSHRTKLRIQVTFNYRMVIPFADWVIYQAARGREIPSVLRMPKKPAPAPNKEPPGGKADGTYESAAQQGVYIMPIRATYNMRMQSNFYLNKHGLPEKNECLFPFKY
ncbi:pilus assembly protein [Pyxidicoccus fallax]|uniref:Pilus assembly protein n=2 Tax=Pyxidicoccus fallax TaxID=394095 RepID=A0A848LXP2_9BACT|nr:TadE family protein [Pyxidicoccus fallax]NMO22360.1 pilus assembly protein [Pyxidicoccus fallax]NPC84176.1 pilus assembly protein [Pyxidicoccus fallax]